MAKVDWITWKTEPKELINLEKVEASLINKLLELNNITNGISDTIKVEIEKGGLSKESLTLKNESPNNVMANKILKELDNIRTMSDKLSNKIRNQVASQKELEKEQLITVIEEKIDEQEKILQNTMSLRDRISTSNNVVNIDDVNSIITATNEKITMLKERLNKAKAI